MVFMQFYPKKKNRTKILIVASLQESELASKTWGTGGWLPPDDREYLDWYTLVNLLGWSATVVAMNDLNEALENCPYDWIILAFLPELMGKDTMELLIETARKHQTNIILRQGNLVINGTLHIGFQNKQYVCHEVSWFGMGSKRKWSCKQPVSINHFVLDTNCQIWAANENNYPVIVAKDMGKNCRIVLLGFHPSEARDNAGVFSSILKHLLIFGINHDVAWVDWSGTMLLRMDDPGSSETVHHDIYSKINKINREQWRSIGNILSNHNACLNIGYVSGWVDDGDEDRGLLQVDGKNVERVPGKIHPSPEVLYVRTGEGYSTKLYNYKEEYEAIMWLINNGLADIAVHGYTHIFPDSEQWLNAPDCHNAEKWFREYSSQGMEVIERNVKAGETHPIEKATNEIYKYFKKNSATLINPGEKFTVKTQLKALELNFKLISSYYTALRIDNRFCWAHHVCAPYIDKANSRWFDAELPVIGYFHDFDICQFGTDWFDEQLMEWRKAGAVRFYDFSTFIAELESY
jgi:hypothetical protein